MTVAASAIFDFLASRSEHSVERHIVVSEAFSDLRRSVRRGVRELTAAGGQEALEVGGPLRRAILLWLTAPVHFDNSVLRAIQDMGEPEEIEGRWGRDVRGHFEAAIATARELAGAANPLRGIVLDVIRALRAEGRSFRIVCHKQSRHHFDQRPEDPTAAPLPEGAFIHTPADYRGSEPFDVLLKVGPLRSSGWGSAPDAIRTAPRFGTLVQVVWSGCHDQQGFGYDPLSPSASGGGGVAAASASNGPGGNLSAKWLASEVVHGDPSTGSRIGSEDEDDLEAYAQLGRADGLQRATLVQVDDSRGILLCPGAKVLALDADQQNAGCRQAAEDIAQGTYIIWPVLDDASLGGHQANGGCYSPKWKEKLDDEARRNLDGLVKRLRDAGLGLATLKCCIENWRRQPSSVIRAPQQRHHFRILIDVLGVDFGPNEPVRGSRHAWWEYAWDEVRRSRGEAIKSGREDQDAADNELLKLIGGLRKEIKAELGRQTFELPIPPGSRLSGKVSFYRVLAVEYGFEAPEEELRKFHELEEVEQWRT
ncbi:MAG: hypothetical protein ACP5M4_15230 [Acidobacteriaceae bacterium]